MDGMDGADITHGNRRGLYPYLPYCIGEFADGFLVAATLFENNFNISEGVFGRTQTCLERVIVLTQSVTV